MKTGLLAVVAVVASCGVVEGFLPAAPPQGPKVSSTALNIFGWGGGSSDPQKDAEKDEAYRKQQEILAMRNNPKLTQKYYKEVESRRKEADDFAKAKRELSTTKEDPIIKWRELKKKGIISEKLKLEGYDIPRNVLVIPKVPFGIAKYDDGERFDLRLPYVDQGYVDKEANSFGSIFKRFLGGAPTSERPEPPPENPKGKGGNTNNKKGPQGGTDGGPEKKRAGLWW